MRAKHTLYLPLFVVLFLSVSQYAFGQAGTAQNTAADPRHESLNQREISILFDQNIFSATTAGWSVTIGGTPVNVTGIAFLTNRINLTIDASPAHAGFNFIIPTDVNILVSYNQATGNTLTATAGNPEINTITNIPSKNNAVFNCTNDLTFFQQGLIPLSNRDICAPVVMNFTQYQFIMSIRYRNSSNYRATGAGSLFYNYVWGDGVNQNFNPYPSDAAGTANAAFYLPTGFTGSMPGIILTSRAAHTYPATNSPAPSICSWDLTLTPVLSGGATCNSLAQATIFATYDTDNANSGTLSLQPSPAGSNLVCLGDNVNMRFSDATQLNCRAAVEASVPNDLPRHIRIVYGSTNFAAGNIADIRVGGVPVTANADEGPLLFAGGYFPTGGGGVGVPDANGVIELPTPVTAATALTYMRLITTTATTFHEVGERFYVRIDYWDVCNPYDPFNLSNRVSTENFVEIINSPNPPTVNSPNVCETTGNGSYNITATGVGAGVLTYTWYLDAARTTVLQAASTDNTFNPVTEGPAIHRINPAVTGSQTFTRYVTVTQGSNNCTSQPQTITIRIDDQNTAGAIAHPLGASPITVCSGTDPVAFTSTTAGTGGGPDGPDPGTDGDFVYQWQSATDAAFTTGVTTVGTNSPTFDPPAVTGTIFYRRQVISGNCATVSTTPIEFRANTPVVAGVISGTQTICTGQTPTTLGSTTAGSGGNGTPTYSWQQSTDNFGADINTIGGATSATYSPGALTVTTWYRRVNTSGVCIPTSATTAPVQVTVQPVINPGAVAGNQTICSGGDPVAFTSTTGASGGNGALTYRWQSSTTSAVAGFANITPAATADVYDAPTGLTQTTWYRRVANGGACTEQSTPAIQVTVNPLPTAANPTGGGAVCGGNPASDIQWTLTGTPPFNFTYTVRRNGGLIATIPVNNYNPAGPPYIFTITDPNPPTDFAQPIVAGDIYAYQITALSDNVAGSPSCTATAMGTARNVTIGGTPPAFASGPSVSPTEVCVGGTVDPALTFELTLGSSVAGNYTLTYRINAGGNQTKTFTVNPATGQLMTTLSFTEAALDVAGTHTIRLVSIESPTFCLTPLTNVFNYIVRPLPVIGTQPTAQEVCASAGTATFTVAATGTALEYQWQEQVGGVGAFNNIVNGGVYAGATTASLTLTNAPSGMNTNRYQVIVRSVFPTTFSCPVTSNAVALTVRPFANITAQPPNRVICSGDATTFGVTASVTAPSAITAYQWQISTTGPAGAYTNLTNVAPYSNVTTATMTITGATTALSGNHYRVVVTTTGSCPLPSSPGSLTVNPLPASNAITPIVCEDIVHVAGSPSVGTGSANNVDLTQFSVAIADAPGAPVEIPAGVVVLYYNSAADRSTNTSPLTTANITPGKQIFVRTRITATGCFVDQTITFTVRSQPAPTNLSVQICEDNPPGSLVASNINLTSYENTITASAANRNVEWYLDQSLTTLIPPGALPNQEQNFSISATTTVFAKIIDTTPGTPGCHSVAELRLEYQARPNPNTIKDGAGVPVGATYTVCASNSLVFLQIDPTINPGSTYTWNVPTPPALPSDPGYFELLTGTSGFFIILRFPSLNPSPGVPISVTERLGTANCAGTTINTSIIVEGSPPTPVITGPQTVCANSPATYSVPAVAGNSYSWSVPPGATITSTPVNSNTIDVMMSTFNGNVNVVVSNSTGCLSSGTVPLPVTVVTKPSMTSPNTNTICSGQAPDDVHTLTATLGGTTYRWEVISILGFVSGVNIGDNDGSVLNSNTPGAANIDSRTLTNTSGVNAAVIYRVIPVSPPTAGVYCEGPQQNVTITIQPEPNLLLTPKTICSDEPANYEIKLSTAGLPSLTRFTWSAPVMSDGSTQGTSGTNVPAGASGTVHINDAFLNTSPGTITATYTISAISGAGCSSNQAVADRQVVITINPKPLIATTLDKPVCSDEAIALTLNTGPMTAAAANYSIVSQSIAGLLAPHAGNATVPQASVAANYLANDKFTNTSGGPLLVTYTVNAVSSIGGCQGPDQVITITVNSGPTTNVVTDEVCSDVAGGTAYTENLVNLQPLVNPDGTLIFQWFEDEALTTPVATPTAYAITVQNPIPRTGSVYVKVDNGVGTCAKVQEVTYVINPTPAVTASITSNYNGFNVRCIGSADGTITANVATLGSPNYTYSVDGSNFFTGRIFNGLAASNNPFTITVRDAKGCTATTGPMNLTEPPVMTAVNAVTSNLLPTHNGRDLTCPGASDGQITVTAGGGTGSGYSYRIIETNATNTTGVFNGLPQGVYTVIVTDKAPNNCTITSNQVTITPPPVINASATLTDAASCNGASDGEITAIASGGTLVPPVPPNNYTFTITPGGTSNNTGVFTGLASSGVPYTVTVRDDNGCTVQSNGVVVTQPAAISAFISVNTSLYPGGSAISCFGANDAQLNVTANGGNGGYGYVLNVVTPGAANTTGNVSSTYTGVSPGVYTATVTDSRGCNITSGQVTVAQPADINVQQFITNPISCNGDNDGQIRLVATGGTGAFTYLRTAPPAPESNGTGIFSNLSEFNYPFEVRDINGCLKTLSVALTDPDPVVLTGAVISDYFGAEIKCPTSKDGIIQLSATGGNGNFMYSITNPVLAPPNNTGATSGIFNGLGAATYTFHVVDPKGCNDSENVTITPPTAVTISAPTKAGYNGQDITCTNATDAVITVSAGGGTVPPAYTYVLSPSSTNTSGLNDGSFENVAPGTYTVTTFDANGCSATSASITINPYAAITFPGAAVVQYNGREISCFGAADGRINSTPSGGAGGWTNYSISPTPGTAVNGGNGVFTGLPAGSYVISAQDANACASSTVSITVHQPDVLVASANVVSSPTCFNLDNASVRATAVGGTVNYVFSVNTTPSATVSPAVASQHIFTGLAANPGYIVTVTDVNGCTDDVTVAPIVAPSQPLITASITSDDIAAYHNQHITCFGANDAIITALHTAGTGTGSLTYTITGPSSNTTGQFTGVFTLLGPGGFNVTATDINGCASNAVPLTIIEPPQLQATLSSGTDFNGFDIRCFNEQNGIIIVTPVGGTGNPMTGDFQYVLMQSPSTPVDFSSGDVRFNNLRAMQYQARVRDLNGCTIITNPPFELFQPTQINLTAAVSSNYGVDGTDISCVGANDGEISVVATIAGGVDAGGSPGLGIADYTYVINPADNTTGATTGVFTGLRPNTLYTITATDANTCTANAFPVIMFEPTNLFAGFVGSSHDICIDQANKTTQPFTQLQGAFGGNGSYEYRWMQSTVTNPVWPADYTPVGGATAETYTAPTNLATTTHYVREVRTTSATSALSCPTLASNKLTITVNPRPTVTIAPAGPICQGTPFGLAFNFTGSAPFTFDYDMLETGSAGPPTAQNNQIASNTRTIFINDYQEETTFTVTRVVDRNECEALPITLVPREFMAQRTVPIIKVLADLTVTSPNPQCSGETFTFAYTVDPDVTYRFTWPDGEVETITPAMATGTISRVIESLNTGSTTQFPIILLASHTSCQPLTAVELIDVYPRILTNVIPSADRVCSDSPAYPSPIMVTNNTLGGQDHKWTVTRLTGNALIIDDASTPDAIDKVFRITNTTAENPAEYRVDYVVTNDASNGSCQVSESFNVFVYKEAIAKIGEPKDPLRDIEYWGMNTADHGFFNTATPAMEIEFQNATPPLSSDFVQTWTFSNNNPNTPPQSFVNSSSSIMYPYLNPGTGKRAILNVLNQVAFDDGVMSGCPTRDEFVFTIRVPPLNADFDASDPACLGTPDATIRVVNNSTGGTLAGADFVSNWEVRDHNNIVIYTSNLREPTFPMTTAGRYSIYLTVSNPEGATPPSSFGPVVVDIYPNPLASFITSPSNMVFIPEQVLRTDNRSLSGTDPLTNTPYPIYYIWDFGDNSDEVVSVINPAPNDPNSGHSPTHRYTTEDASLTIRLTAVNEHGALECRSTVTQAMQARSQGTSKVPNAFTPNPGGPNGGIVNEDGTTINDVFLPITKGIKEFKMQIFDRWGNLVFESQQQNRGWDGYDRNGNLMPAGVYVYKLVLRMANDQRTTQVGDVTLIR